MRTLRRAYAAMSFLLLAVLACNLPFQATPVPTAAPDLQTGPTPTPAPTDAGPPATEPSPIGQQPATVTPTGASGDRDSCTLDADFVSDVTIPDDSVMEPGTSFVKTWRVRNGGTCNWDAQTKLVFDSGDQMNGPDSAPVGAVKAGAEVDLSVSLEAPSAPGTYRGDWQLEKADGTRFGPGLYVRIVVAEPTAEPTETVTPTVTAEPTETLEPTRTPTETAEACVPAHPQLEQALDLARSRDYEIGCPIDDTYVVEENGTTGAVQAFWANVDEANPSLHFRSLMVWRPDTEQIYVIDGVHTSEAVEGELMVYSDTWDASEPHTPPGCADMSVPDGYQLPERGFGKVWCQNELVDEIGWPDEPESPADILAQPTENGLLMRADGPNNTYLLALLPDAGEAIATWSVG